MNIAKIFLQSLGVTSHSKTFLMVCHFQTDSCLNEFGIHLNSSGYPFQKKNVMRSNGLSYLFTKNVICLNGLCYLFEWFALYYPFEKIAQQVPDLFVYTSSSDAFFLMQ